MNGPKASIDQCANCTYWERINSKRGVCHIISSPEKFKNDLATIEILSAGKGVPESKVLTAPGSYYASSFMPVGAFWCALYKVGKPQ